MGSKIDWRETLEVSVEELSGVACPVSMSRLKASTSSDCRPGFCCTPVVTGRRSLMSRERRRKGFEGEMLRGSSRGGGREGVGGDGEASESEDGVSGLGLNGSTTAGGGSGVGCFLGLIWDPRRRGATGGGGLFWEGLVGGCDEVGDVEDAVISRGLELEYSD